MDVIWLTSLLYGLAQVKPCRQWLPYSFLFLPMIVSHNRKWWRWYCVTQSADSAKAWGACWRANCQQYVFSPHEMCSLTMVKFWESIFIVLFRVMCLQRLNEISRVITGNTCATPPNYSLAYLNMSPFTSGAIQSKSVTSRFGFKSNEEEWIFQVTFSRVMELAGA